METDAPSVRQDDPRSVRRRIDAWAEVITILALATFFAFSFFTRVHLFVAPMYIWLSAAAAVALFAMGAARLLAHFQGYVSGEMEEQSAWQVPVSACVVILILPVVLAVAVNPRGYSQEGLRKRRVTAPPRHAQLAESIDWVLGAKAADKQAATASVSLPENPTILDVLRAVNDGNREAVEGRFVSVMGQCDLLNGPNSKRFDLYRLVVTCCIADATAVSVEIARKKAEAELEPGSWIRVEGVIRFDSKVDPSMPVVHATETSKIPEPLEPYL